MNLREEPQLYINNQPFVLRFLQKPMRNISIYQGILGADLEKLEARLKVNALQEIPTHHNKLLCHDETAARQVVPCWITPNTIQVFIAGLLNYQVDFFFFPCKKKTTQLLTPFLVFTIRLRMKFMIL